jgi:hypothetical protein
MSGCMIDDDCGIQLADSLIVVDVIDDNIFDESSMGVHN